MIGLIQVIRQLEEGAAQSEMDGLSETQDQSESEGEQMDEKTLMVNVSHAPESEKLMAGPQGEYMPYPEELNDDSYFLSDEEVCRLLLHPEKRECQ